MKAFSNIFSKTGQRGQILALAYVLIVSFLIIAAVLVTKAITERNLAWRQKLAAECFYLAEGATEDAIAAFTQAIADFAIAPAVDSFTTTTDYSSFPGATATTTITRLEDVDRAISEGSTYQLARNYDVSSTVTHPQDASTSVTIHQIISRNLTPAFQYAVFYEDDLEMLPGANMTLSGKVHCNKDIYMDADSSGNILTIDSIYLRSAGNIYNKRKDSSTLPPGDVSIRVDTAGSPTYELMSGLDSSNVNWRDAALARWQGTVQSTVHGVIERTVPSIGSILSDGYYASEADVVIENEQLTKGAAVLTEGTDYPVDTISTATNLYNAREGKYIESVDIDMKKLAGYAPGDPPGSPSFPNNLPTNGLLYATKDDAAGSRQPGIRLINGAEIERSGGLTVVSNDPVYVQGNYNTVNEQPASIICDSLNILSNAWNNAKIPFGSLPAATSTTVNSAFIAGVDATETGKYNGGLENYPRLHENWSGKTLSIKGSFVSLWESAIATERWIYGSPQYTAPIRSWQYNSAFNNSANLPPFTPWAVEAGRVAWWKE